MHSQIPPFSPTWGLGHSRTEPTTRDQSVTETWEDPLDALTNDLTWGCRDPSENPFPWSTSLSQGAPLEIPAEAQ